MGPAIFATGDFNNDGVTDVADLAIFERVQGLPTLNGALTKRADFNADGLVDETDRAILETVSVAYKDDGTYAGDHNVVNAFDVSLETQWLAGYRDPLAGVAPGGLRGRGDVWTFEATDAQ